ncbi:ABC transporter permease [Shinella daejeonensis]|uniref:ABC transporter permease n=1 Tax=Shinella daejeonensis TaxID=659017 RepID=UPI0020C79275|nr:ABC transporter permease [Shinella daejeonensis]MCP8894625.1 ABC transporter permease [Shinella daejeonensis]
MSDVTARPAEGGAAAPARNLVGFLESTGPLIALILLMVIGSLMSDSFLGAENLSNVFTRSAIIGIIAVGATFVITAGGLDLSVGSLSALVAGVTILFLNAAAQALGANWMLIAVGIAFSLLLGAAAGLLNGVMIVKGRVEAFIVTLGAMGIFRSLLTWLADGGSISLDFSLRDAARPIYYGQVFGIAVPILVLLAIAVIGELALRRMRFGRHVAAIGSSRHVARYSAIPVNRVRILTYVIQGVCVAIATVIYVPRLGAATPSTGLMWELEAIAAVIIGGTALSGGFGRIWGTIVGVLILGFIGNILNLTGFVSPYLNGAFQGAIIIIAVLLQRDRLQD